MVQFIFFFFLLKITEQLDYGTKYKEIKIVYCFEILKYSQVYELYQNIVWQE